MGGGRAPACARDQESADADPALRGAARGQARAAARGAPTQETLRRGTQTIVVAGRGDEAHGRRFRDLRPAAAAGPDAAASTWRALLLDVLALYDNLRPHVALALAGRTGHHPGRADPPAPGVPQSSAECGRCPGRRSPIRDSRSRSTRRWAARRRLTFGDRGPGFDADVLEHAFEPYVTTKAKGTGPGLRHREEDRRRASRTGRAREHVAARRARDAVFPAIPSRREPSPLSSASTEAMQMARMPARNTDRRRRSRHPRAACPRSCRTRAIASRSPRTRAKRARYRQRQQPALVLLDIWMPDTDGVTLLREWGATGSADDAGHHDVGPRHDRDRRRGDEDRRVRFPRKSRSGCRSCCRRSRGRSRRRRRRNRAAFRWRRSARARAIRETEARARVADRSAHGRC